MSNAVLTAKINADTLREMLANGYRNLKRNMAAVDELNVFPVPDGDTGKNMTMTIEGGVSGAPAGAMPIGDMMKKFSRSTLLSARGNSGVILSQFIRGLALGCEGLQELSPADFAQAFRSGTDYAYKAVAKPVEGTMLTLLKEAAALLERERYESFEECFEALILQLKCTLQHTPELLPVLKDAGVVDSGGAGLLCIFEGMQMLLLGERVDENDAPLAMNFADPDAFNEFSTLEYGYCTEFILQLLHSKTDIAAFDLAAMTARLEAMGDSVVTVQDDSLIKVHVHTFAPEEVLAYARAFGEFVSLKIENMSVQHSEVEAEKKAEWQKFAIVSTATGEGLIRFFKEIGVSEVIDGGRTNNPSAEDFLAAFERINADHIVVLPNDGNVIMTAEQAAALYQGADVRVIPTRSIAEGYSALSMMDLEVDTIERLLEDMTCNLAGVTTGFVTTAIRDANLCGIEIHEGDWMGLEKDTVYASTSSPLEAAILLFERLPDMEEKQVITAFVGKDVPEEEIAALEEAVNERYPLLEIGFMDGGQDVYRYIFAIE